MLRLSDGLLLVKERQASVLHAIDLADKKIAWTRRLSADARIVSEDDDMYYLHDPQLVAISKSDRRMQWSTGLPAGSTSDGVVDLGDELVVATSRGLFAYEKTQGDRTDKVRPYEEDIMSGRLVVAGSRLISVSNAGITAYAGQTEADEDASSDQDAATGEGTGEP